MALFKCDTDAAAVAVMLEVCLACNAVTGLHIGHRVVAVYKLQKLGSVCHLTAITRLDQHLVQLTLAYIGLQQNDCPAQANNTTAISQHKGTCSMPQVCTAHLRAMQPEDGIFEVRVQRTIAFVKQASQRATIDKICWMQQSSARYAAARAIPTCPVSHWLKQVQ